MKRLVDELETDSDCEPNEGPGGLQSSHEVRPRESVSAESVPTSTPKPTSKAPLTSWSATLASFFSACIQSVDQTVPFDIITACSGTGSPTLGLQACACLHKLGLSIYS